MCSTHSSKEEVANFPPALTFSRLVSSPPLPSPPSYLPPLGVGVWGWQRERQVQRVRPENVGAPHRPLRGEQGVAGRGRGGGVKAHRRIAGVQQEVGADGCREGQRRAGHSRTQSRRAGHRRTQSRRAGDSMAQRCRASPSKAEQGRS